MTRILFLTHSAAPAGAELSLLNELTTRVDGSDVVVVFGEDGEVVERFKAAGIPCVVLPIGSRLATARRAGALWLRWSQMWELVAYSRRLRRALRGLKADVIVGRSLKAAVYGRLSTVGFGVKFVWCLHDRLTPEYLGRSHRLWSQGLSRVVDAVVVNSFSTLSTVRTHGKPVLVLPPAIAPGDRAPVSAHPNLRVLCLARLSPWKGQDVAIRAFAASLGDTDATLRIVGGPLFDEEDYHMSLRTLVDELGLAHQVEFVGHLDDPAAEIAYCDVLVHSSRIPEPFGLAVLEGMQAGRVVIATSPGGPAEIISNGVNGFLAEIDSVDSLAAALHRVYGMSSDERVRVGDEARMRALTFNSAVLCAQHLDWLTSLVCSPAVPELTVAMPS